MKFFIPVLFVLASQLAGAVGSFFTVTNVDSWYSTVNKPFFNPPNWIFGPVWITLYTLMGIAAYLVWKHWGTNPIAKYATILFFIHLAFNSLWSILFFGMQNPMAAFFEIIVLWIMIAVLIYMFFQVNKTAAYLLVPYILWVSFASILNFYIWRLNL
ncbi:TspO protein [Candidatus Parcubacteria bacterium]|nr:MAG: TspO protein [Candidatus Parcubacteria bacterium]